MTKYHTVEELAGAEHEAGPRKLRVLEAHVGLVGITEDVSGTMLRQTWQETKSGLQKERMRTPKDRRDFVTYALGHVEHSTVHKQGSEEGMKRKEAKKPLEESGPPEHATPPVKETPTILLRGDIFCGYAVDRWTICARSSVTCGNSFSPGGGEQRPPLK